MRTRRLRIIPIPNTFLHTFNSLDRTINGWITTLKYNQSTTKETWSLSLKSVRITQTRITVMRWKFLWLCIYFRDWFQLLDLAVVVYFWQNWFQLPDIAGSSCCFGLQAFLPLQYWFQFPDLAVLVFRLSCCLWCDCCITGSLEVVRDCGISCWRLIWAEVRTSVHVFSDSTPTNRALLSRPVVGPYRRRCFCGV